MADLSDVMTALGTFIGGVLYPSGATGEANSPACGVPVMIVAGWPSPQSLDTAMQAGKAVVSIYPTASERNTTRFPTDDEELSTQPGTFTISSVGQVITVGGAQPSPYYFQNLVAFVNGQPYRVQSQPSDTPASLAAALQALIAADISGSTVSGVSITLPATARIGALRIGTTGTLISEIGRQERAFQITAWASSPAMRDAVSPIVDVALRQTKFLTLADQTLGRLVYKSSPFSDFDQKQGIFRRDLIYTVEYGTTITTTGDQIVISETQLQPTFDGVTAVETIDLNA